MKIQPILIFLVAAFFAFGCQEESDELLWETTEVYHQDFNGDGKPYCYCTEGNTFPGQTFGYKNWGSYETHSSEGQRCKDLGYTIDELGIYYSPNGKESPGSTSYFGDKYGVFNSGNSGGSGSGTAAPAGTSYWKRSDGTNTLVSLGGSTAKVCTNGTETVGTFNSSTPSMTFVVSNNTIVFPLIFKSSTELIVRVPSQASNSHEDVLYTKVSTYSCGGSSNANPSTPPPTGNFRLRVYAPKGACANSTGITGFRGTLKGYWYSPQTKQFKTTSIGIPSGSGKSDSKGTYWESLYNNTPASADGSRLYKIEWEFYPNVSFTFPNSCWKKGSSSIDSDGQTKNVTVEW
ncbi:hypothetical protein [Aquiflexum gelatinilyticum]|uniref:Uncharacterized protein n=1 Tax=Aquiflexum gelatinilyticum TaxID=2961943 RepID=A0A9X2SZR5_9BACT|nr:hypothetical protein [Aquiflexum gelatinilyticum]MCR9014778.1 hypothetical protein [Aquiflexum gelatinilyticum]